MASWAEFAAAAPEMADLGRRQLEKFGLAYLATTRADGSPRVNPVCPVIVDGRVFIATSDDSPKRLTLQGDGRYMLHMLPGKQEEEFWIRGRARRVLDEPTRTLVVDSVRGELRIKPDEWLFEYDIDEAGTTMWEDFGTEQHRPARRRWRSRP